MTESYTGRKGRTVSRRERESAALSSSRSGKLFRLILKQISAAVLCTLVVLGMHSAPVSRIRDWSAALGRALRYETDLTALQKNGAELIQWFQDIAASPKTEPTNPAPENAPLPENTDSQAGEITQH